MFGLDLKSEIALPAALGCDGSSDGGRRATLTTDSPSQIESLWKPLESVQLVDRRYASGKPMLHVHQHPELGYRIWAPRHGLYLVSLDGARIQCALPKVAAWRWQRLLFAQALPLAATLQGLELFHASAIAIDGVALGMIAPSGTGKTSLAAHLVSRGATFVTDDVMALEARPEDVVVHPGAGIAGVRQEELRTMDRADRARLGAIVGRAEKSYIFVDVADRPVPLTRLYYLERTSAPGTLELDELMPPDPRLLLSSSFLWYLTDPAHLLAHLDACAGIAQFTRMFRVRIPTTLSARDVARAIETHVEG